MIRNCALLDGDCGRGIAGYCFGFGGGAGGDIDLTGFVPGGQEHFGHTAVIGGCGTGDKRQCRVVKAENDIHTGNRIAAGVISGRFDGGGLIGIDGVRRSDHIQSCNGDVDGPAA